LGFYGLVQDFLSQNCRGDLQQAEIQTVHLVVAQEYEQERDIPSVHHITLQLIQNEAVLIEQRAVQRGQDRKRYEEISARAQQAADQIRTKFRQYQNHLEATLEFQESLQQGKSTLACLVAAHEKTKQ